MPNEDIFSPEYQPPTATQAEELAVPEQPIEFELEEAIKQEVKTYGSGKPRRVFIRADIVHD